MAKEKQPKKIELSNLEVTSLRERIQNKQITDDDLIIFEQVLLFMLWIQRQLERFKITTHKLRQIIFGDKTEKRNGHCSKKQDASLDKNALGTTSEKNLSQEDVKFNKENEAENTIEASQCGKTKAKGHGRIGADEYEPDEIIHVKHSSLTTGDDCPTGCGGRLYQPENNPGGIIRVIGQPCAHIVRYEFDKLRCALCGSTFTAEAPSDFPPQKYNAYFKANLVIQKYFMASPFYRQERYQKMLGFPLPDSTQWDLVESVADCAYPVLGALEQLAANGTHVNNDDTKVRILDIMRENKLFPEKKRKGMFTTCIFAQSREHKICLYYSGVKHAGENLLHVLEKRDEKLPPIIHMCDALSANIPASFKTILCNCLTHGRRKFTDIETFFPEECGYVIDQLSLVYKYDSDTKERNMTADERLQYHQTHSAPIMETLKTWMQAQLDERKGEPNSTLGGAIRYMQNHWIKLTKFLSVSGAHLDNNIVERALKLAIRSRKNAMFHKSLHGAFVAGLLLSLIATCELENKNPVHYLTALQEKKSAVFKNPDLWLPWNYEAVLANTEKIAMQKVA